MSAMIFNNDRMQYVNKEGMYYLSEFIKVPNLSSIQEVAKDEATFFKSLHEQLTPFEQHKLAFISSIQNDLFKVFILHEENPTEYLLWMKCQKKGYKKILCDTYDFKGLQRVFQSINNKDGAKKKGLKQSRMASEKN